MWYTSAKERDRQRSTFQMRVGCREQIGYRFVEVFHMWTRRTRAEENKTKVQVEA